MARIKWTAAAVAGVVALGVAGCGSSNSGGSSGGDASSTSTGDTGGGAKVTAVAIATPEKRNDFGWNEQGVKAVQALASEMGIQSQIADGSGYDNIDPVLSQLANGGAKLIFAHASGYNASAPDVAAKTGVPEVIWDNPEGNQKGLVNDAETDSQEGAYLAGIVAAKTSTTKTLGIVISADDTNWNKQSGGFIAGARSVDPSIKILLAQIGQAGYADSAGGKRVAQTVIAGGADVVIGMGDGSSFGMLQAVEQAGGKVKFIDVIGDKSSLDKKHVLLTSVLWNFEPAYKQAIEAVNDGTFGTQVFTLNLKNGGISLLKTPLISADAWSAAEAAKQKIEDGQIQVPLLHKKSEVQALLKK